jgi:hypothetical protein
MSLRNECTTQLRRNFPMINSPLDESQFRRA